MKQPQFTALLLMLSVALAMAISCASLPSQHQKIGAACNASAAAAEAIADATDAGLMSKADAKRAADLYHSTDRFCEPVADSLTPQDYAALLSAAASLANTARAAR